MREHWRDRRYWLWLWREAIPAAAKLAVVALLLVGLVGAGWAVADRVPSARTQSNLDSYILVTTVQKLVTVPARGRTLGVVGQVVPRTKTVHDTQVRYQTRYQIRVVTSPGEVKTVRRLVTRSVPVVTTQTVKVNGVRVFIPTTTTQAGATVTQRQTITNTQTSPSRTVRGRETETRTVTQTQTRTVTRTEKVVKTVTNTVTKTVTEKKKSKTPSGSSGG